MANGMHRTGDWQKVYTLVRALPRLFYETRQICLKRWALKAEGIAKKHMSAQDLGWQALKASTVAAKVRRGDSELILHATSTYFQSITSWNTQDTAYAGVKRDVKYVSADGTESVADIARIHEFGTKNIPKRPLWKPTFDEVQIWHMEKNNPVDLFIQRVNRYAI